MKTSHTPGPWAICPETDGTEIVAYSTNPWTVHQRIAHPIRGANWIANASLIAAAPDLLAALEAYVANDDIGARVKSTNFVNARDAIARATGEA